MHLSLPDAEDHESSAYIRKTTLSASVHCPAHKTVSRRSGQGCLAPACLGSLKTQQKNTASRFADPDAASSPCYILITRTLLLI